jgi:hypothetical protein
MHLIFHFHFDEISRLRIETSIGHSAFYKFAKKNNSTNNNNKEIIEKLQFEFCKQNNINYLILANKTPLPDVFKTEVDTIIFDEVSGKSFVFLIE